MLLPLTRRTSDGGSMIATADNVFSARLNTYFLGSLALVRTIANILDIRTDFQRVAEITNTMLPHDALTMVSFDRDGHLLVQVVTTDFPEVSLQAFSTALPDELIVRDLT